jgi:uncharacterized surface protein with fasciclin (FAS1) repeats
MANLVDTAKAAGSFNTLLKAIEAAGIANLLNSPGPFTVLAPTDDAFASLPDGTLNSLLQDIPKLKRILLYHVLSGEVLLENLTEIDEAPTEEGSIIAVDHTDGIQVNEAKVIKTDILADNGVIHVIDAVLVPAMLGAVIN